MRTSPGQGAVSRRDLLRSASGTAVAGTLATGAVSLGPSTATAQESPPDYGGWFDDVDNFEGTVDRRGQDAVTIEVGVEANGGPFGYAPAAVMVSPGTTVAFEWVSDTHNVVPESQPDGADWTGTGGAPDATYDTGHTYTQTFETTGVYTYFCQPHLSLGMKGAVVVRSGQPSVGEPDYGGWFDDVGNFDGTVDERGTDPVTVDVGVEANGGPFGYGPAAVRVSPGTTVRFEWISDTHNVVPESQPDGADWTGTEGAPDATYDTGHTYEHTFATPGVYTYFCQPHLGLGMKGAIVVGTVGGEPAGAEGTPTAAEDEEQPAGGPLPGGEFVSLLVGLALGAGALSVLVALAPELGRSVRSVARNGIGSSRGPDPPETVTMAPARDPVHVIDHDEYDPIGTATLIAGYLLILVVMWFFMYFVEFLGRGPTVIG